LESHYKVGSGTRIRIRPEIFRTSSGCENKITKVWDKSKKTLGLKINLVAPVRREESPPMMMMTYFFSMMWESENKKTFLNLTAAWSKSKQWNLF
jgi:hypothetical protein